MGDGHHRDADDSDIGPEVLVSTIVADGARIGGVKSGAIVEGICAGRKRWFEGAVESCKHYIDNEAVRNRTHYSGLIESLDITRR